MCKVGAILFSYLVSILPAFVVRAYNWDSVSSSYLHPKGTRTTYSYSTTICRHMCPPMF